MGIQVVTTPENTTFRFPEEPGFDELYEAEQRRRHADTRFWSGFTMLAYVLVLLIIGYAAGWDANETLRSILFAFGGAMIGRLLDKMRTQREHTRQRIEWVKQATQDPKWNP
jgi:hypothetical protein